MADTPLSAMNVGTGAAARRPLRNGRKAGRSLAIAAASLLAAVVSQGTVRAEPNLFQKTVNYVFTGTVAPADAPEIVDPETCVILLRDKKYNRYIKYYLERFKMDDALFDKKYSGARVSYQLSVKGDDVVLEYLDADKKTVLQSYRSAQIALPGDIEQTRKALKIIYSDFCKPEKQKAPF